MQKSKKIIGLILSFVCAFQQIGMAQGMVELNVANRLALMQSSLTVERFRPEHLRYFSYSPKDNNFTILLDKGDLVKGLSPKGTVPEQTIQDSSKTLLKYFLIGVTLPDDNFWVNLRPDSPDNMITNALAQTDLGRILLEADLQLKKDTAKFTSPETPEGKAYWDRLYKKAGEIFGSDNITIPTLTRPWIVPGEIIVREDSQSAYIYKANLKVMLEEDYLKSSSQYSVVSSQGYEFNDTRLKALNTYSTQLVKELIIPKLTKEINNAQRYAALRQVYYSLILSRWFKMRFAGQAGTYPALINKGNLTNLTSTQSWSKDTYFQAYQKSFKDGEYNIKTPAYSIYGQTIRSYFSGGFDLRSSSPMQNGIADGKANILAALRRDSKATAVLTASAADDITAAQFNMRQALYDVRAGKPSHQAFSAIPKSADEVIPLLSTSQASGRANRQSSTRQRQQNPQDVGRGATVPQTDNQEKLGRRGASSAIRAVTPKMQADEMRQALLSEFGDEEESEAELLKNNVKFTEASSIGELTKFLNIYLVELERRILDAESKLIEVPFDPQFTSMPELAYEVVGDFLRQRKLLTRRDSPYAASLIKIEFIKIKLHLIDRGKGNVRETLRSFLNDLNNQEKAVRVVALRSVVKLMDTLELSSLYSDIKAGLEPLRNDSDELIRKVVSGALERLEQNKPRSPARSASTAAGSKKRGASSPVSLPEATRPGLLSLVAERGVSINDLAWLIRFCEGAFELRSAPVDLSRFFIDQNIQQLFNQLGVNVELSRLSADKDYRLQAVAPLAKLQVELEAAASLRGRYLADSNVSAELLTTELLLNNSELMLLLERDFPLAFAKHLPLTGNGLEHWSTAEVKETPAMLKDFFAAGGRNYLKFLKAALEQEFVRRYHLAELKKGILGQLRTARLGVHVIALENKGAFEAASTIAELQSLLTQYAEELESETLQEPTRARKIINAFLKAEFPAMAEKSDRASSAVTAQEARAAYKYIGISMGGDKLAVAVVDGNNNILKSKELRWNDDSRFKDGKVKDTAQVGKLMQALIEMIEALIAEAGVEKSDIHMVNAGLAGPVNKELGIFGSDFRTPNLPFDKYLFRSELNKLLQAKGIEVGDIKLGNDAEVARDGELMGSPGGIVIIGTGINIAVGDARDIDESIKEAGHNLVRIKSGEYIWVGDKSNGGHPIEKGNTNDEIKKKSGKMGEEYVRLGEINFRQQYPGYPIIDWAQGERDFEDRLSGPSIRKRVLQQMSNAPTSADAAIRLAAEKEGKSGQLERGLTPAAMKNNSSARAWIVVVGEELGRALAAFIYQHRERKFVEHLVLVSGVAENLGKGVYGSIEDKEKDLDIFIKSMRIAIVNELKRLGVSAKRAQSLAAGVVRSKMDYTRELAAYRPSDEEVLAVYKGGAASSAVELDRGTVRSLMESEKLVVKADTGEEFTFKYRRLSTSPSLDMPSFELLILDGQAKIVARGNFSTEKFRELEGARKLSYGFSVEAPYTNRDLGRALVSLAMGVIKEEIISRNQGGILLADISPTGSVQPEGFYRGEGEVDGEIDKGLGFLPLKAFEGKYLAFHIRAQQIPALKIEGSPEVRQAKIRNIKTYADQVRLNKNENALNMLKTFLSDSDPRVRLYTIECLVGLKDNSMQFRMYSGGSFVGFRGSYSTVSGQDFPLGPIIKIELEKLQQDPDFNVRKAVVANLAKLDQVSSSALMGLPESEPNFVKLWEAGHDSSQPIYFRSDTERASRIESGYALFLAQNNRLDALKEARRSLDEWISSGREIPVLTMFLSMLQVRGGEQLVSLVRQDIFRGDSEASYSDLANYVDTLIRITERQFTSRPADDDATFTRTLSNMNKTESSHAASSAVKDDKGGIDFVAMPIKFQPMGSFNNLNLSLPRIANLEKFNLDSRIEHLKGIVRTGSTPLGKEFKEVAAACIYLGKMDDYRNDLIQLLAAVCQRQETELIETDSSLKETIVIVDNS